MDAFKSIVLNNESHNVLLVVHGQVMKMILSFFRTVNGSELFNFISFSNCEILKINHSKIKVFKLKLKNDESFDLK